MLDKGKDLDWFASPLIVGLAIVAAIGFVAFLIWELTEQAPDRRPARLPPPRLHRRRGDHRRRLRRLLRLSVLIPLWLQTNMGYTAT